MQQQPPAPPVIEGVEWVRPGPTRRQLRNDVLLALVLAAASAASLVLYRATGYNQDGPWWASLLWAAAMTLPLALRRRFPDVIAVVASAAFITGAVLYLSEALFSNIALFIAIYTVGAWGRNRRRAFVVRLVIVLAMFGWLLWSLIYFSTVQEVAPELGREGFLSPYLAYGLVNVLTNLLYFGGAWYFGDASYRSARERAALEQRTAELAAERERSRRQAVQLERVRIARELHDVVAHHVSVIGVQAGAARRVLSSKPDAAVDALSAIETSSREAVTELHALLGTLRADGEPEPTASTLGIAQIETLAAEASAAGLPTAFAVVGEPRQAPTLVEASAYRVAQEALTNVRKHAGAAATADVRIRWTAERVELEVANTGIVRRSAGDAGETAGLGLVGMRERVAATGGELELGPRARGGYLVRAAFPLQSDGRRPATNGEAR
ncbi:histidine kinase [Agromyces sp. NBRC 114283]|uniref:sensor histidine kinase n=1 Tax=Agromyces sp. NBRC 114283 TaxID=2994521 RepID=UPI0024A3AAAF|nr:histidine kinase [Agromyces sp. NBRC 114283]GLU88392.1 two-component sensor histidine kinase [Agromyces sp. NBRC 114283]